MERKIASSKIDRFSPSMMIDYISCPRLFYYRYISKIQLPQKQIHLLFGGAIHKAVECIYDKQEPFKPFEQHFDKEKLMDDEKGLHKEYIDLGYEMIRNYLKEYPTLNALYNLSDGQSEVYIKRYLKNPLTGETSSLPMSGRIDRLTTEGRVVEYKTSKNKWNQTDANYKIQTLLYNLWYLTEHDVLPLETIYIVLLKKYKKVGRGEILQVLSKHCTIDELAGTFEEVEIILNKINNNEFDRPRNHPKWCDCYKYEEALNFDK